MPRFKGYLNLHNSGLLLAGFLGSTIGSSDREIGRPDASMSVSQFYVGKIDNGGRIDDDPGGRERSWGLPPPPRGYPQIAIVLYYLYRERSCLQVIRRNRIRSRPLWGQGWRKGGGRIQETLKV